MRINLKKRKIHMLLVFVVVAFLFWFLFMRKREGFLEGAARMATGAGQTVGTIIRAKKAVIKAPRGAKAPSKSRTE
jgi:hypothetical protein